MKIVKFETEANQEQLSQASFNSAFLSACENGDLHGLDQLLELAPNYVPLMIKEYGYRAFLGVAAAGHLLVLNRLVELAPAYVVLQMIQTKDYFAFQDAARGGHLPVLNRLVELAPELVSQMIAANRYEAFQVAVGGGHLSVLNRLVELAPTHVSRMIKAKNHAAFQVAASGGHLPVLNRLMELAPDLVSLMIEASGYGAFQMAAHGGHLPVLNRLVELAPAHVSLMIEASVYTAFQSAAVGGHLPVLNRLMELAPAHVSLMIEASGYTAFQSAASGGHLPILNRLVELAPAHVSLMIKASVYTAFQSAARGGHLPVLNRLVELAPDLVSQMIGANNYNAFLVAAGGGHMPVLNRLVELAPDLVSRMIEADDYEAFQWAADGGHLPVLNRLVELAPDLVSQMIEANDYEAFQWAARGGHLSVLNRLVELAPDLVSRMIEADGYAAFQGAATSGQLLVLNRLVELVPDQVSLMMEANSYLAFQGAAGGGHLPVLNRLMELAPAHVSLMIEAADYTAFQRAAIGGHPTALNRLMELAPDRFSLMIEANGYAAFSSLALHHMDDLVNRALCDPSVFAHAEMHQHEYGEYYVNPLIQNALTALRAMKTALELESPNAVFNINDETQATRCFYMIRNLIRRNQPALIDDIRFLLAIPAVKALAHTPVINNEPNELLRLALTTGHQEAAAVLLAIPAVHALAAQHQFYRQEAGGRFDLSALARDRESSMRALSTSEQQRLTAAISRYEPMIKAAGVDNIMSDLRQTLSARYAEEPARIPGGQGVLIALPQDWQTFQALNLTAQQRGEALKAYCQHKDHTAWRYLLKPNPWMAMNASYVNANPGNVLEKWSTFEEYKPLISMLYLAAIDEGVPPTNGYTLETRLSHLIDELAHIGRAHNWDKTRVNACGASEEYDDLKGDKPSCFSGVKRRLFQAIQGHPLFEMLTLDDVKQELRDFMREHFTQHIAEDNLAELTDACVRLYEGAECDVCFAPLNVSETDQHAFLQYMEARYALQFTIDDRFEQHIKTSFTLTKDFPSHVARFAVATSFDDLLSRKRKLSHLGESSEGDAKKPYVEWLAVCGIFRAAEHAPQQNSPTRTLSEESVSNAAIYGHP